MSRGLRLNIIFASPGSSCLFIGVMGVAGFIRAATDVAWVSTQMESIDVSVYHTRVIVKPEGLIPDIDLQGGKQ